jgi:hypothetical protein
MRHDLKRLNKEEEEEEKKRTNELKFSYHKMINKNDC